MIYTFISLLDLQLKTNKNIFKLKKLLTYKQFKPREISFSSA